MTLTLDLELNVVSRDIFLHESQFYGELESTSCVKNLQR